MWKKELKTIKKQMPEMTAKAIATPLAINKPSADISFDAYCRQLNITPIKHDTITMTFTKPSIKKIPLENLPQTAMEHDFDFIDIENSPREFFRHGQKNLPRELRDKRQYFNSTIDLHNMTKNHALTFLERLIVNNKNSYIKIIHGVGLNSEFNQPVLLGTIRKYLTHCDNVLAFSYGSPEQGGNGVTLVKMMK
jgi:DNA-nicking Smr family endonuclease